MVIFEFFDVYVNVHTTFPKIIFLKTTAYFTIYIIAL